MRVYLVTGNKNKLEEVREILNPHKVEQINLDLEEIQELDAKKILEFKAKLALKKINKPIVVEESGIYFKALNGLPGPFTKWFKIAIGNEGMVKILEAFKNKEAEAKTIVAYAEPKKKIIFFEGKVKGKIVKQKGIEGFGFDFIFKPEGYNKTIAELGLKIKNKISWRYIAFKKLKKYLDKVKK